MELTMKEKLEKAKGLIQETQEEIRKTSPDEWNKLEDACYWISEALREV